MVMLTYCANRLDVLRGIISEVTNAAKSSKPIHTDGQMINIIRKRMKSSASAAAEFSNAKRDDLQEKERKQIAVLEEYLPSHHVDEEEVTSAIQRVIGELRTERKDATQGMIMKALVGPGGILDGQNVDKKDVARLVSRWM